MSTGFIDGMKREIRRMTGRKMYIFGMLAVPLFMAFFFLDLLSPGLPNQVPTAVVDLDHSSMSRTVTRSLSALQVLDLNERCESYDEALEMVRKGKIFGFFGPLRARCAKSPLRSPRQSGRQRLLSCSCRRNRPLRHGYLKVEGLDLVRVPAQGRGWERLSVLQASPALRSGCKHWLSTAVPVIILQIIATSS